MVGEPAFELGDLWRGLVLACGEAGVGRHALDCGLDFVEFGDALQPVFGNRGGAVVGNFKQFAVGMGPAIGKPDGRASPIGLDQSVVIGIAVDLRDVGEALQNGVGILPVTPRCLAGECLHSPRRARIGEDRACRGGTAPRAIISGQHPEVAGFSP